MGTFMEPVAYIHTDYKEKFGVPRQSGLVPSSLGKIVFCEKYRNPDYIRGIEEFSHIWLIFEFSLHAGKNSSPTVRPPKLGGQIHKGVFATRAPYRPNNIGLSSVRLDKVEYNTPEGPVIYVLGADLVDNTPIYDIKPYIPYSDCHSDAAVGFTDITSVAGIDVIFPNEMLDLLPENKRQAAIDMLKQDPRPAYDMNPDRIYGIWFDEYNIRFKADEKVLTVTCVERKK